jgi:PAS domain S-box-containing protein
MVKKSKVVSGKTEKLNQKIRALQAKLKEAKNFVEAVRARNIDALVIPGRQGLKVFTDKLSDKPYRILIEEMHEGAITANEQGTILYCNSYFADMVKLPLQKVIGSNLRNYVTDSVEDSRAILLHLSSRKPLREEVYIHPSRGKPIMVMMSLSTLSSLGKKRIVGIILTNLTIQNKNRGELKTRTTQLEEKNIELETANKDLLSFTYISSHDLQEPLRKIQNFVNRMLDEENGALSERGRDYLQRTHETATRMRLLIDDLLVYSSTKTSNRKFEQIDLKIIVDEVKQEFAELLAEKNATVESSHLGDARVIRFQFHQLIQNLVSNSLKFSKPLVATRIVIRSGVELDKGVRFDMYIPFL